MATNYEINYNDERFTQVESDKSAALSDLEQTYAGMINESDKYYQAQIDASKDWADKQSQLQQEKTDFAIEQIEQQKDQAKKDYTKEQSGAYVDWQKQSNQYGANSEEVAAGGMTNTGFAESSQVSMYNTYQNRVSTARESYNRAVLNYDNAIKDARLQNNSVLAEIAYTALQQQLELSLQGFQYKNTLLLDKANKKTEVENNYYKRYQDVLQQINTENAMAEEVRQFNEKMAEDIRQFNEQMAAKKSSGSGVKQSVIEKDDGDQTIEDDTAKKNNDTTTMKSILDLGYGPISAKTLDGLVASGQVTEYEKGGTTLFARNVATTGTSGTYGPITPQQTKDPIAYGSLIIDQMNRYGRG